MCRRGLPVLWGFSQEAALPDLSSWNLLFSCWSEDRGLSFFREDHLYLEDISVIWANPYLHIQIPKIVFFLSNFSFTPAHPSSAHVELPEDTKLLWDCWISSTWRKVSVCPLVMFPFSLSATGSPNRSSGEWDTYCYSFLLPTSLVLSYHFGWPRITTASWQVEKEVFF